MLEPITTSRLNVPFYVVSFLNTCPVRFIVCTVRCFLNLFPQCIKLFGFQVARMTVVGCLSVGLRRAYVIFTYSRPTRAHRDYNFLAFTEEDGGPRRWVDFTRQHGPRSDLAVPGLSAAGEVSLHGVTGRISLVPTTNACLSASEQSQEAAPSRRSHRTRVPWNIYVARKPRRPAL